MKNALKNGLMILLATLGTATAHAKTVCTLNAGDGNVYNRNLFNGELSTSQMLAVSKDGQSAKQIDFSKMKYEDWKAIDGLTIVSFSKSNEGIVGIVLGHIDMSQTSNVLPVEAIASGTVAERQVVVLTAPAKKLSAACFQLNQ